MPHVFISHARDDAPLASEIAEYLTHAGIDVTWDGSQVLPGDNPGEKLAEALDKSDAMLVLMSPRTIGAAEFNYELGFALGNRNYKGRVIGVVNGSADEIPSEAIPWILRKFSLVRIPSTSVRDASLSQLVEALNTAAVIAS